MLDVNETWQLVTLGVAAYVVMIFVFIFLASFIQGDLDPDSFDDVSITSIIALLWPVAGLIFIITQTGKRMIRLGIILRNRSK